VPSGAVPKDGPSAGVAMITALVSMLSGRPVRPRVAVTGEISLSGVVLPVGGIKEKVLGAKRAGIREVILPAENENNVKEDLESILGDDVKIHYVHNVDEALDLVLTPAPTSPTLGALRPPQAPTPAAPPAVH
jgi:ATP-dependent Lon protease